MGYQNIYTPVQHLNRTSIYNGGLCYIVFACWQDIIMWPTIDPITGICNSSIQLKAGATWYQLQVPDNERILSETEKEGPAGPFVEIQVAGYLGGNNQKHILSSKAMQYNQFALLVKDRDGILKLIGDQDSGADYNYSYTSGDIGNSRKRPITFKWQSANGLAIYTAPDVTQDTDIITPPFALLGDFSNEFGNDFNN